MQLRPYQEQILNSLRDEVRNRRNPLVVAPCGSGKGTLIATIVNNAVDRGKRVIFAVHGISLVVDMHQRVEKIGVKHGVLMGSSKREHWHPVQVASIDTLHRMQFPPKADIIICDEAHMSMSPTWRKALDKYPDAHIIGMTATPIRLDGKGLGKMTGGLFDSIVMGPTEQDLIDLGYLVPSRVIAAATADVTRVKKTAGDFNQKQLAQACDSTKLNGDIVKTWQKYAAGRKTAAFGVDTAHANHITEAFNAAGVEWAYVDAKTPQSEREKIWHELDHGNLMGVSSVGCISIGWDHPIVSCLIMARPTQSLGLWKQMLGRGSRPNSGKTDFLVLDHADNTRRHDPYGLFEVSPEWSLDGEAIRETGERPPSVATCEVCFLTFQRGPKSCPGCGHVFKVEAREIEVQEVEMVEIPKPLGFVQRLELAASDNKEHRSAWYRLLHGPGKKLGEGWCYNVFCKKYGYAPPWSKRSLAA